MTSPNNQSSDTKTTANIQGNVLEDLEKPPVAPEDKAVAGHASNYASNANSQSSSEPAYRWADKPAEDASQTRRRDK